MKQKTIWMQLLLIGILSSFQSCHEDVDKVYYEKFYFINDTDHELVIEAYGNNDDYNYSLSKDSTLFQKLELNFGSSAGIIAYSDSVIVKFGDAKRVSFLPDTKSPFNILDRDNYTSDKDPDNHHVFKYYFTDDDYDNASQID
ncbi:MAG: hypothetical protein ACQER7_15860 [Bacteroidota bacterium]